MHVGLVELVLGGLLGWAMVVQSQRPVRARAFSDGVDERFWYRVLALVSFLGVSGGLVAVAITGPG